MNDSWCVCLQTAPCEHRARGAWAVRDQLGSAGWVLGEHHGSLSRCPQCCNQVLCSNSYICFFFTWISQFLCLEFIVISQVSFARFSGGAWRVPGGRSVGLPLHAATRPGWVGGSHLHLHTTSMLFLKICILANAQKGFPWKTKACGGVL